MNDSRSSAWRSAGIALLVLAAALLVLFHRSLAASQVLFSNDGPLGLNVAKYAALPSGFLGYWQDLNWVGSHVGTALPTVTYSLLWLLGPQGFAKFYGPFCLLFLGVSAWLCLRSFGLRPAACLLGALAAMLNSDLLSYTTWGLGTHALAVAAAFLAIAALSSRWIRQFWMRALLAGLAVGLAVMEGFDNGAILSLYVAVFVLVQAWWGDPGPAGQRLARGAGRLALVTFTACWIAAYALHMLVGTQIKGVVGMDQDPATKAARWDEATQWSLPRGELLRIVVAGLHGYRMDTAKGGNYWGSVGRSAEWHAYLAEAHPDPARAPHPLGLRHSGAGFYAGIMVVLLALWALAQAARGQDSVYTAEQRRWIWFWGGVALVSLLLALGRYAPLYQFVYALPYFSTIRNPIKFLHPFALSLAILCAYGVQAFAGRYADAGTGRKGGSFGAWWKSAALFDRRIVMGGGLLVGFALVGWLVYATSKSELIRHLQRAGFPELPVAESIAAFSVREVGWAVLFLALSVGALVLVVSGWFRGARARWADVVVGAVLVLDLTRANLPWIEYVDVRVEYASNPVIDLLRDRAHERRVSGLFLPLGPEGDQLQRPLQQVYALPWEQRLFWYYDIHCLDIVQMPRIPADTEAYRKAAAGFFLRQWEPTLTPAQQRARLPQLLVRQWELTSTRYLIGLAALVNPVDQQFDGGRGRFRLKAGFELRQDQADGPILAPTNSAGPYGVLEFTGALPKVALYSQWESGRDGSATLQRLWDPAFNPAETVLVAGDLPPPATTNAAAGTVRFESYEPKRIRLAADAAAPSVLLLNDQHHPDWHVTVDGQPAPLLKCNFFMRGVQVPPGQHTIEFRFAPPTTTLWISLAAIAVGVGLCGFLALTAWRRPD